MQRWQRRLHNDKCTQKRSLYSVTSDLIKRIQEHRNKIYPESFTAKYNVVHLVYYKTFPTIEEAILEEKRIKAGKRKEKNLLINSLQK